MIKNIKSQLSQGLKPALSIKKKVQIYGKILTSRHAHSPYPIVQNHNFHMNPGDVIWVESFIPKNTEGYGCVDGFECYNNLGQTFIVFAKDIKSFCQ